MAQPAWHFLVHRLYLVTDPVPGIELGDVGAGARTHLAQIVAVRRRPRQSAGDVTDRLSLSFNSIFNPAESGTISLVEPNLMHRMGKPIAIASSTAIRGPSRSVASA